jgi:hypothetical protein
MFEGALREGYHAAVVGELYQDFYENRHAKVYQTVVAELTPMQRHLYGTDSLSSACGYMLACLECWAGLLIAEASDIRLNADPRSARGRFPLLIAYIPPHAAQTEASKSTSDTKPQMVWLIRLWGLCRPQGLIL